MSNISRISIKGQLYDLKARAVIDDIFLGGDPTATTPDEGTVNDQIATTEFVSTAIINALKNQWQYPQQYGDTIQLTQVYSAAKSSNILEVS